jgi:hypothetical protein
MVEVTQLLDQGLFSPAWESIRSLGPLPPGGYEWLIAQLLERWYTHAPDNQVSNSLFKDDPRADFQFVPAAPPAVRGDRMLVVFSDMGQKLGGCPLPLLQSYLSRLGVHVLYIRDLENVFYLNGQPWDSYDLSATIRRIETLSQHHGITSFLTMGTSSGGFGALHWGLQLPAQRIVSLAGPTNLTLCLPEITQKQKEAGIPEPLRANPWAANAAARLRLPGPKPQFRLIVAANNDNDTRFAQDLGSPLPSHITIETLEQTSAHNVLIPLVQQGRLEPLLLELVGP